LTRWGNVIKQQDAGSSAFTLSFYDGVRRLVEQQLAYTIKKPEVGDIVMQQTEAEYDEPAT